MTVIATGVDYSDPSMSVDTLRHHGASFVCRYASTAGNPKNLTSDEVSRYAAAGIPIVSVFETTAQRALDGHEAGLVDGASARAQFAALGMPVDRPIYFAVDFDAQPAQMPAVRDYLAGVATAEFRSPVGTYGGLLVCADTIVRGVAHYVFQTYAWSHGQWAVVTHLRQVRNGVVWDGHQVDLDEAHAADYGGWLPVGTPTPTPAPGPAPGPAPVPSDWTQRMITNLPEIREGALDAGGTLYVRRIQALLQYAYGFLVAGGVDGAFGPHTDGAVRAYQRVHGLAVDGIVGPHTWALLLAGQAL